MEIVFVRNASSNNGEVLTPEGEAQSRRAGEILTKLGFIPDLIVTSSSPRCRRTGELIAQGLGMQPRFAVLPKVEHVTADKNTWYEYLAPIVFAELGYERPISEYLARDKVGVLMNHAEDVAQEIRAEAGKDGAQNLLIVGHHISQNLIGIALAGEHSILLGPEFQHLTGYWIHRDESLTSVHLID